MQPARVEEGMVVIIEYTITTTAFAGEKCAAPPATCSFIFGADAQYRSVEAALLNRCARDRIHVHVPPEEIYGKHDPSLVRELFRFDYKQERLRVGKMYRQMRRKCLVQFLVKDIRDEVVVADLNDPKAGTSAEFDILIKAVREAKRVESPQSVVRN